MKGRKCNTPPFTELLFLSFLSRHFCFKQPKCAFFLVMGKKKKKKGATREAGSLGETRQYAHKLYIRGAEVKPRLI